MISNNTQSLLKDSRPQTSPYRKAVQPNAENARLCNKGVEGRLPVLESIETAYL